MVEVKTIQQAAEEIGLSTYTLRYYEEIGLVPPVPRAENGHRRYGEADLGWLSYVRCLKSVGMPLEDIKRYVALQHADDPASLPERLALLETHRAAIRAQIRELEGNLRMIEDKIGRYTAIVG